MTSKYDKVTATRKKLALASFQPQIIPLAQCRAKVDGEAAKPMPSVPQHPQAPHVLVPLQELQLFSSLSNCILIVSPLLVVSAPSSSLMTVFLNLAVPIVSCSIEDLAVVCRIHPWTRGLNPDPALGSQSLNHWPPAKSLGEHLLTP